METKNNSLRSLIVEFTTTKKLRRNKK